MTCKCKGTGRRDGFSEYLDCMEPGCNAATERAEFNQRLKQAGSMSVEDAAWWGRQDALGTLEKPEPAWRKLEKQCSVCAGQNYQCTHCDGMGIEPRKIIGYDDCKCVLSKYCDGQCNPIWADHPA